MIYTIKNWHEFQHYKDRRPPWVKLHRWILDDFAFQCLPDASRAVAPMLWLLASEKNDGSIEMEHEELAFRLHLTIPKLQAALKPLIDKGFVICDIDALARCEQQTRPETEESRGETEDIRGIDDIRSVMRSELQTAWNETAKEKKLPTFERWSPERIKAFNARYSDRWWREHWRIALDALAADAFCLGQNDRKWKATIDYFLRQDTVTKLVEKSSANKTESTIQGALI